MQCSDKTKIYGGVGWCWEVEGGKEVSFLAAFVFESRLLLFSLVVVKLRSRINDLDGGGGSRTG